MDTPKQCLTCSTPLDPRRRKFCSQPCAMKWHNARQVWSERPDREKHNARKRATNQANPELNRLRTTNWRALHPERYKATKIKQVVRRRKTPWAHALTNAETRAARKKIPFDLTDEWAIRTWTGFCAISKLPLLRKFEAGHVLFAPSIDRVVPKLGYTQANSRFVCLAINMLKHEETDELMYDIAEAIVRMKPPKDCNPRTPKLTSP